MTSEDLLKLIILLLIRHNYQNWFIRRCRFMRWFVIYDNWLMNHWQNYTFNYKKIIIYYNLSKIIIQFLNTIIFRTNDLRRFIQLIILLFIRHNFQNWFIRRWWFMRWFVIYYNWLINHWENYTFNNKKIIIYYNISKIIIQFLNIFIYNTNDLRRFIQLIMLLLIRHNLMNWFIRKWWFIRWFVIYDYWLINHWQNHTFYYNELLFTIIHQK